MYFYYYFSPLNNDRLNPYTNPCNISVAQQRFSLMNLGYLCFKLSHVGSTKVTKGEPIAGNSEAPNDGFLLNTLKTLFRLSRVLLDL